jgi:hypothetical protein
LGQPRGNQRLLRYGQLPTYLVTGLGERDRLRLRPRELPEAGLDSQLQTKAVAGTAIEDLLLVVEAIIEKRGLPIVATAGDRVGRDRGVLLRGSPLA